MVGAADFVKMTLLGLIVGLLVVLLFRLDFLIQDFKQSVTKNANPYQIKDFNEQLTPKSDRAPSGENKKFRELEKRDTVIL